MNDRTSIAKAQRFSLVTALAAIFFALSFPLLTQAREAAPLAQDEAAEKRLNAISSELRCLVCQNESLAGSNAELAHDLRRGASTFRRVGARSTPTAPSVEPGAGEAGEFGDVTAAHRESLPV